MSFHKEGITPLALCILFIFVLNAMIQFYYPQAYTLKWFVYIASAVLFLFTILYFRSPSVTVLVDNKAILSPVSGTITIVDTVEESEYITGHLTRISISTSPFDGHIFRSPVTGTIQYVKYHPEKSAAYNAHTAIGIENAGGAKLLYRHVAGPLSSRVITYVNTGDKVEQGAQIGYVKIGGKMDIFLPAYINTEVAPGDVVTAGATVIASLKV